ncbi:MAG: alpha/beta hydrolase [Saprospiraceae bacterium]|nr:alpha/beta hydrolase [Saprospiraceae bacterium]
MMNLRLPLLTLVLLTGNWALAQASRLPKPDLANVQYGIHERNVLDVWLADTTKTSPLAIYIHGGGFVSGSKEKLNPKVLQELVEAGISVASINYRFLANAPLPAAHHDALRALQFLRSKAEEWKFDKLKIAAFGGSAGAQLSMWLAFSDEMAKPDATDPIERESSRLHCVATSGGQTTMNIDLWKEWIPGFQKLNYTNEQLYGDITKEERLQRIEAISALSIVSSDDPPIFMTYHMKPDAAIPSNPKKARGWKIHHVILGIKLKEKMDALGVESHVSYPDAESKYESNVAFLKRKLLR